MPHIIVKLWPGRSELQKQQIAERITRGVEDVLKCGDDYISVAFEEVESKAWAEKVFKPDIVGKPEQLYKKPGYTLADLP